MLKYRYSIEVCPQDNDSPFCSTQWECLTQFDEDRELPYDEQESIAWDYIHETYDEDPYEEIVRVSLVEVYDDDDPHSEEAFDQSAEKCGKKWSGVLRFRDKQFRDMGDEEAGAWEHDFYALYNAVFPGEDDRVEGNPYPWGIVRAYAGHDAYESPSEWFEKHKDEISKCIEEERRQKE